MDEQELKALEERVSRFPSDRGRQHFGVAFGQDDAVVLSWRDWRDLLAAAQAGIARDGQVAVWLTAAECVAINQFMSYGSTRGNHDGDGPGLLTPYVSDMIRASTKAVGAIREAGMLPTDRPCHVCSGTGRYGERECPNSTCFNGRVTPPGRPPR